MSAAPAARRRSPPPREGGGAAHAVGKPGGGYPMSYTAHVDTFARDNLPPRE